LRYDRDPGEGGEGVDPGMLPREPGDQLPGDVPGLPELPELPGPPLGSRAGGSSTGIPLPPVRGAAEEDNALAAAARPLPRKLGRGLPVGQNRLQQPERVTPVGGEQRAETGRLETGRAEPGSRVTARSSAANESTTRNGTSVSPAAGRADQRPAGSIQAPQRPAPRKEPRSSKLPTFWQRVWGG
jgi:hypothetical protein